MEPGGESTPDVRLMWVNSHMGVEPKIGGKTPQIWWFIMENPIRMDDLGGVPPIFGNIHIKAGWWFQIFFIFIPIWGNDSIWRAYFSDGLVQPPTRKQFVFGKFPSSFQIYGFTSWFFNHPKKIAPLLNKPTKGQLPKRPSSARSLQRRYA